VGKLPSGGGEVRDAEVTWEEGGRWEKRVRTSGLKLERGGEAVVVASILVEGANLVCFDKLSCAETERK